ncbi:hypothetical protein EU527_05305 [Candidatus Thorarchaeota archaeon]|nr:MAG: hypothetical protein EU527_05305 [Candidatus Thorarchaeota archaeon]
MRNIRIGAIVVITLIIFISFGEMQVNGGVVSEDTLRNGSYVDKITYRVITNHEQRILALKTGTIDMDTHFFDPYYVDVFEEDPDVSIFSALRNGYGHLTINCRDGGDGALADPVVRRAFAYAFDKTRVISEVMDGFSIEHDSLVPAPNGFCIEDELEWHYYTNQTDIGNQILDDAGYEINSETGYRELPDGGGQFSITLSYSSTTEQIGGGICQMGVDAFATLHIQAVKSYTDFLDPNSLSNHGDYDIIFYAVNFYSNDVDWLAYEYWSEYADVYGENPTNFVNATYDSWRNQLLYGTTYEQVYEAAAEMQKILHYNVPRLVVYVNTYLQAYRTDQFTGHVEDLSRGISGPWTMRKIHRLDGSIGGTVKIGLGENPDSFNFYVTDSSYTAAILEELWPSLYTYGPDATPWPDLADFMLTETHSDNPAVPEGHTRFTIDIIQNATWSDGVPLTSEDVVYTFTYAFESGLYGNPAATTLGDLVGAYTSSPYRAVIEFTTESYWYFSNFAYMTIIPKHIFQEIGFENWNTWNPVFDPNEPHVTCGPFILTSFKYGEYYELSRNSQYHYAVEYTNTTTTDTSTSTTSTTNQTNRQGINWSFIFSLLVSAVSAVVILYCSVNIVRKKNKNT